MNLKTFIWPFACKLLLGSAFAQSSLLAPGALTNGYQVTDRSKDFAVIAKIRSSTNAAGQTVSTTNGFTLLENNLHYLDNGAWKVSEDLVEIVPGGAAAQRGPDKALFSSDLNSAAVFDITTSDGLRLQGGVRAIRLTDKATGNSLVIAPVKQSAPGAITPPNQVVYQSGFDGLDADVVYVWKHNSFSQDVIFKQQPALPVGMDPNSTVLEVLTEFVQPPVPALHEQIVQQAGRPDLTDDVTIRFGQTLLLRGNAYAADNTLNFGGLNPTDPNAVGVLKQWQTLPDGRTFLVESVIWQDIAPLLQNLPAAQRSQKTPRSGDRAAQASAWPRKAVPARREPMRMASLPYKPKGFVLDYVSLSGTASSATFASGSTYYIQTSYGVGTGQATFQPGCVVKYAANAYLMLYGGIVFPDTLQTPVFTSKDDDGFGEVITGSTGGPGYAASPAIMIYYDPGFHEVLSARIRWASLGVSANTASGGTTISVRNSFFENCNSGVSLPSYSTLTNVKKHNVNTPIVGGGVAGTMTDELFYTATSFAGLNYPDGDQVPDTMGAVGQNNFVELLNGASTLTSVAAYSKSGGPPIDQKMRPADFFAVTYKGTSYPLGVMDDAKILYDKPSQRWVACGVDLGTQNESLQNVILAVSNSDSPVPLASNWTKYLVAIAKTGSGTDSSTLGVDVNGVYMSVLYFHHNTQGQFVNDGNEVVAIKKPDIYQGSYVATTISVPASELNTISIQPVVDFDTSPMGGYAWFVAKGPSTGQGTNYRGGPLQYCRLSWTNSTAQWVDADTNGNSIWRTLPEPQPTYLDYYDLDGPIIYAPQLSGAGMSLQRTGSRLRTPVIMNQVLWVCQHVGLDGTDGNYGGNETGATVDRSAIQWLKLQLNSTGAPLTHIAHGRIYDAAASIPYYYYMPSLMVNTNGDMVTGFSASKATEYIGAFYFGRLANGTTSGSPMLIQAGTGTSPIAPYWGDYSYTSLDPVDGSFWTVQEYAFAPAGVYWGTWTTKINH